PSGEQGRGRLWRLEPTGSRTLLASNIKEPRWAAVAEDGTVYISAKGLEPNRGDHSDDRDDRGSGDDQGPDKSKSDVILRLGADGTLKVFAASFDGVEGIAVRAGADRDALHTVETRCKDYARGVVFHPEHHSGRANARP